MKFYIVKNDQQQSTFKKQMELETMIKPNGKHDLEPR